MQRSFLLPVSAQSEIVVYESQRPPSRWYQQSQPPTHPQLRKDTWPRPASCPYPSLPFPRDLPPLSFSEEWPSHKSKSSTLVLIQYPQFLPAYDKNWKEGAGAVGCGDVPRTRPHCGHVGIHLLRCDGQMTATHMSTTVTANTPQIKIFWGQNTLNCCILGKVYMILKCVTHYQLNRK